MAKVTSLGLSQGQDDTGGFLDAPCYFLDAPFHFLGAPCHFLDAPCYFPGYFPWGNKLRITDVMVEGKRVFIRVDLNVTFDKQDPRVITDPAPVEAAVPTIQYCLEKGAKSVVLASHLDCPQAKMEEFSLEPVADALASRINHHVTFLRDCIGPDVERATADPETGSVFLLENVLRHKEEVRKGLDEQIARFRADLAKTADIYVCDVPALLHRNHTSMCGLGLPRRAAGKLVGKELDAFSKVWSCALCQQVS